jgi:hypothetical protein
MTLSAGTATVFQDPALSVEIVPVLINAPGTPDTSA